MILRLRNRFDPAAQLVDPHHALGAEQAANGIDLPVEIIQRMGAGVDRLAQEFGYAAHVVMGPVFAASVIAHWIASPA